MNWTAAVERTPDSSPGQSSDRSALSTPSDHAESGGPGGSATAAEILNTIWQLWHVHARWPTWKMVDRHLYQHLGLKKPWSVVGVVDRSLLYGVGDHEPEDTRLIGLTVAGLNEVPNGREDAQVFVKTVQAVALHLRTSPPVDYDYALTSDQLPTLVQLPAAGRAELISRQLSIWQTTHLWSTTSGPDQDTGEWSVAIKDRAIRAFTEVEDVAGYLAEVRSELDVPAVPDISNDPEAESESESESTFRTERLVTLEGATYTIFLDHELARHHDTVVYVGHDAVAQPVAVKRVTLRDGSTEPWYRDAIMVEREQRVTQALEIRGATNVLPMLGHRLDDGAFTFVFPLAATTLGHVVELVGLAKRVAEGMGGLGGAGGAAGALDPDTSPASPVSHQPERFARDLYGSAGPDEEAVRQIGVELTTGLLEMHNHGVLHRDIKPANIMRWEGRWRLGDLGIAKLIDDATTENTWLGHGTPGFMAPEVSRWEAATARSDVYSLGCTLYALLTGSAPFSATGAPSKTVERGLDLSGIESDQLKVVLAAMLHRREGARPSAERVLQLLSASQNAAVARLRQVSLASARIEAKREAARDQQDERRYACDDALESFSLMWSELETLAEAVPDVRFVDGQGAWIMLSGDWRLVVQIFEPGSSLTPAVQLGTVLFDVQDRSDLRTPVANVVALWSPGDDAPRWRIYRMTADPAAPTSWPIGRSRHDGYGGMSHQHLEEYVRGDALAGPSHVQVSVDTELTADGLVELFANEVRAIEQETR